MLIACPDGPGMVEGLKGIGVSAAVIGKAEGGALCLPDGTEIDPPGADELYRLF